MKSPRKPGAAGREIDTGTPRRGDKEGLEI